MKLRHIFKRKAKKKIKEVRIELKKSAVTAIIAAFGFLIALSWRDVLIEWVTKFSEASPIKNKFISASIVTIISIIGILVVSKLDDKTN
jgi:TRAP-type C4-dicarboxylate transport system permease small subunit